jgi:SAM-dependent methyltransferase
MSILSIFYTQNPHRYWLQTLIYVGLLLAILIWYRNQNLAPYYEGFSQDSPFVYKEDAAIYDDFYVEIYDRLMKPDTLAPFIVEKIVEQTMPNKQTANFLDIGSGTGHLVNHLQTQGYRVYGIDKSEAMVKKSEERYPDALIQCGNVQEPMLFEKGTFTHILCTGLTFYQFQDKVEFFRNCYFWLQPGGYLILHLVDRNRFDTIVPGGKPPLLDSPQQYAKSRITDTAINFIDFQYAASYRFSDKNKTATFKEVFTDELTKNVRQNELVLYMDDTAAILQIAAQCGFLVKGSANMKPVLSDEYQYLYTLERPSG